MFLTRQEIMTRYRLRVATMDYLFAGHVPPIVEGEFRSENGRRVLDVTEANAFTFECARNDIGSFGHGIKIRGVHPLPFHRFMLERFLTVSLEGLYDELFQLPLLDRGTKFSLKHLEKIHAEFMKNLPERMRDLAKNRRPPAPEEKPWFDRMLRALGIDLLYTNPYIVEQFDVYFGFREELETFMSSQAKNEEVIEYLRNAYEIEADTESISMYRMLFYDLHAMTIDDVLAYMPLLRRTEHRAKHGALGRNFTATAINAGHVEYLDMQNMLHEVWISGLNGFFKIGVVKTPQSAQIARSCLDPALKAQELLGKIAPDVKRVKVFEALKIREVTKSPELFKLDEEKESKDASAS
jgi:hypothetical protein